MLYEVNDTDSLVLVTFTSKIGFYCWSYKHLNILIQSEYSLGGNERVAYIWKNSKTCADPETSARGSWLFLVLNVFYKGPHGPPSRWNWFLRDLGGKYSNLWFSRRGPDPLPTYANRGSVPPSPLKNHKDIRFLSNTGPGPLKNHKATKPAFNLGPLSARQRNVIYLAFVSTIFSAIKKKQKQKKKRLAKLSGSAHAPPPPPHRSRSVHA